MHDLECREASRVEYPERETHVLGQTFTEIRVDGPEPWISLSCYRTAVQGDLFYFQKLSLFIVTVKKKRRAKNDVIKSGAFLHFKFLVHELHDEKMHNQHLSTTRRRFDFNEIRQRFVDCSWVTVAKRKFPYWFKISLIYYQNLSTFWSKNWHLSRDWKVPILYLIFAV